MSNISSDAKTEKINNIYINNMKEHKMSFVIFVLLCLFHVVMGILIGGLIEGASRYIDIKYGNMVSLLFQIILNILTLSILRYYAAPIFIIQLQSITAGLLFVALYFGIQSTLYTNSLLALKKLSMI